METITVINRAPSTIEAPGGVLASFGRHEVPRAWWNRRPRSVLVPWETWVERLAGWPEPTLRAEAQRAEAQPLLSDDADLDEIRSRLRLLARARGGDPTGELRDVYTNEWDYHEDLWATVRHYRDAQDLDVPGNSKIILSHFTAAYHGKREPIRDSDD